VLKALVLGEEERGQSQYQVMCFVTKFTKSDFISSDAMAKLRQVSKQQQQQGRKFKSIFMVLARKLFPFHMGPEKTKQNNKKGVKWVAMPQGRDENAKSCLFLLFLVLTLLLRLSKLP